VAETVEQVGAAVGELTDGVWVLSAMVSVLSRGFGSPFSIDDPAARVLESYGLFDTADAGLVPRAAFVQALAGRAPAFADGIRSTLGQAATAALCEDRDGDWGGFADEILVAQGRASAMGGTGLALFVIPVLEGLAQRFAAGDGVLLDVGVGVAELACAFCEAVPGARVVGIDPLPRAVELGAATVARHGLIERVELRCSGVQALDDDQAFDLAWLPMPFIPRAAVRAGLPRVLRALRPGGWLLLPGSTFETGASGDIARWQAHLAGGTLLSAAERAEWLAEAGFGSPTSLTTPPGAPPILAVRRLR
jgi:SAM-dependent methyltransferase